MCVFAVKRGNIKGRIDTSYNHPKYANVISDLESAITIKPFGEIIESISGGATPLRANEEQYCDSGIRFLRIQNICPQGFDFTDIKYITEDVHNNLLKRSQLKENDLLMTITGRIGTCAVVNKDCLPANINQHIVRIRLKEGFDPKFFAVYLNSDIGRLLSNRGVTGTTRIALDYESIKQIPVPIIEDSAKKEYLVSIINLAFEKRKEKLTQYLRMIDSIPEQMTEELGVQLSLPTDILCTSVHLSTVLNNHSHRFDPKCFSPYYEKLRQELKQSKHKTYKLFDLITDITSGEWGKDPDNDNPSNMKCLVLRATEFDNTQNISVNKDKVKYRSIPISSFAKQKTEIGDILVEKSGGSKDQPVGRVVYVDFLQFEGFPVSYSNFLTKLKINNKLIDPYYLFEYLRFIYAIGLTEVMQNQTNGIRNLIMEEFLDLTVIVPTNNREIGDSVKAVRKKAMMIKQEAEKEWQEARKQFEKELLEE